MGMSITGELLEKRMTMKVLFRVVISVYDSPTPPHVLVTSNKVKAKKYLVEKTVNKSFGSLMVHKGV